MAGIATAASHSGASLLITQQALNTATRSVSIYLSNNSSKILMNPQIYNYSGYPYTPPQPTVGSGVIEICSFGNTIKQTSGAVGVLTYDIAEDQEKGADKLLAIMFSVPFDYSKYKNWFALGFFDIGQACNACLYELMYYKDGPFQRDESHGSAMYYQCGKYILRGTMSPMEKAEMKVELWVQD